MLYYHNTILNYSSFPGMPDLFLMKTKNLKVQRRNGLEMLPLSWAKNGQRKDCKYNFVESHFVFMIHYYQ